MTALWAMDESSRRGPTYERVCIYIYIYIVKLIGVAISID